MKIISVLFVAFYLFCCFAVVGNHMIMHEEVHKAIYKNYEINSTITYGFFKAYTTPIENCPDEICTMLQVQNEIVSYNLQSFMIIVMIGFFSLLVIILTKYDYDELQLKYNNLENG